MQEWYSAEELSILSKITKNGINVRANRNSWQYRIRSGKLREYHINDLPEDIQLAIKMTENMENLKQNQDKKEGGLASVFAISGEELERAELREKIVKSFVKFMEDNKLSKTFAKLEFCNLYNDKKLLNDHLMRVLVPNLSEKTLYNWEKAYKAEGISGLADSYGSRKGKTIIDTNDTFKDFILGMIYSHPHTNCKLIMRGLRGRFDRSELPSYRTLQNWVAKWKAENSSTLLNVTSPDCWRNKFLSATGSYSENITRLNQLWEYDSTPTDIILNDGKRHNIVGVIDVYSRRIKFLVSRTSNSGAVASITRQCLLDWGVPEKVKTDNGADYASKHIMRVFEGLEIEQTFCPPFTPQAKPHIERVFKTFSHDLVELLPGYIGHNVSDRKDIESRKSFADHIMGNAKVVPAVNMSVEEFQEFCDNWINHLYMHQEHGGLKGKTPFEVVANYKNEVRKIQNERALDILLSETSGDGLRTVTKKGIAIDGNHYDSQFLAGYEGKQVKVLFDEASYGEVFVFSLEKEFICKAICPERKGISRKEVAVAKQRLQKQLVAESKQALKKLAKEYSTKDIAKEILNKRIEETDKVVLMPKPATEYNSKFLDEAENILKKPNRKGRELSKDELSIMEQLENKTKVVAMPVSPRQKYNRWLDLDLRIVKGEVVSDDDLNFYRSYQKSTEFKAEAALDEYAKVAAQ